MLTDLKPIHQFTKVSILFFFQITNKKAKYIPFGEMKTTIMLQKHAFLGGYMFKH